MSQLESRVNALIGDGWRLKRAGETDAALKAYDDALDALSGSTDPVVPSLAVQVMLNRGVLLKSVGEDDGASSMYVDLINIYGQAPPSGSEARVAKAMLGLVDIVFDSGQHGVALQMYDAALKFCTDHATDQTLLVRVDLLISKAASLCELGQEEQALALCRQAASELPSGLESIDELRCAARTRRSQAAMEQAAGHASRAREIYEAVVVDFCGHTDPLVASEVRSAEKALRG